ncbi:MAG: hypothetical protein KDB23_24305, partial [Planctomycetales bacterium]|nr:hypothetical protein [Planctomycetales bacterium]
AFTVDPNSAAKVANWLIRTQDPSGGWGYQGREAKGDQRERQDTVQQSLSAAGCGSSYVVGDLLRLTSDMRAKAGDGLPPALRVVRQNGKVPTMGPVTDKVNRTRLKSALADGDQWFERNFTIQPPEWVYYYMYALERYKSFRELTLGREEKEPDWYNTGVDFLKRTQADDGSWSESGAGPDTCFGILFLIRGTRKSIQKAEGYDGLLKGGRGLPGTADVTIGANGQIVKTPFQGEAESLLSILESSAGDDLDTLGEDLRIKLSDDPATRSREMERLRRLAGADEFAVRMAALQALYSTRDLDNVPTFIFALGDPDPRIVRKARDALRLLSRKINGFGLGDDPTDGEKLDAISRWKEWYQALRPDAQFLN